MAVEFTVIEEERTRLFRCRITQVTADLERDNGITDLYIRGNFDNFRTFVTPSADDTQLPDWSDFDLTWVYETKMAHILGVKLFVLTVLGKNAETGQDDAFVGEASIDLLTLATGPTDITLSLTDGDVTVGRIWFNMVMLEIAEVTVDTEFITVTGIPEQHKSSLSNLKIRSEKRGTGRSRESGTPDEVASDGSVTFYNHAHHSIGTSVADILEEAGLELQLVLGGLCGETVIGGGNLLFSSFLSTATKEMENETVFSTAAPATGSGVVDHREVEVAEGDKGFTTHKFSLVINFEIPLLDENSATTEGRIRGCCRLRNMPIYVQMYAGRTVDGHVVEGRPYPGDHPMPPFIHGGEMKQATLV